MLARTGGSRGQDTAVSVAANAHLGTIKRFSISALAILASGGALAAIIALKAALFVWVYHYY
jgi:hypothetical protein